MAKVPPDSSRNPREGGRRSLRELMEKGNGAGAAFRAAQRQPEDEAWEEKPAQAEDLEAPSAEENASILAAVRRDQPPKMTEEEAVAAADLRDENERLRGIVSELRQLLDETTAKGQDDGGWSEQEKEYEAMLEDKSETIRTLHVEIQELEGQLSGEGGGDSAPSEQQPSFSDADLSALSDDLERERIAMQQQEKQLESDRMQLREDEDSMMRQMREMELQMAKERAELARQRNELQRLHSEIRHELELAQRDAAVNERLKLLRRNQPPEDKDDAPVKPTKKSSQGTKPKKPEPGKGGSGLLGRLFGRDKK